MSKYLVCYKYQLGYMKNGNIVSFGNSIITSDIYTLDNSEIDSENNLNKVGEFFQKALEKQFENAEVGVKILGFSRIE